MKMPNTLQITKLSGKVPVIAAAILLVLFGIGVFAVGFDQGQIFSIVEGSKAFNANYIHELAHDMRHASGFPCH